jgi:hypothetical protein
MVSPGAAPLPQALFTVRTTDRDGGGKTARAGIGRSPAD